MRSRVRIQRYISQGLRKRLAAYAGAQDVTESAIAEAALEKYLEPDRTDEALVARRLDLVVQVLGRVEERLEVVAEALGRFVRFSFKVAPEKVPSTAVAHGEGLYRDLLVGVSRALGTGTTFLAAVRRARSAPPATVPGSSGQGGQAGGGAAP
jgi:hypothetical protein